MTLHAFDRLDDRTRDGPMMTMTMMGVFGMLVDWATTTSTTDLVTFHHHRKGRREEEEETNIRVNDEEHVVKEFRYRPRKNASSLWKFYKILGFLLLSSGFLLLLSSSLLPPPQVLMVKFSTTITATTTSSEIMNSTSTKLLELDQNSNPQERRQQQEEEAYSNSNSNSKNSYYDIVLYPQNRKFVIETILKCWDLQQQQQPSSTKKNCHLMYHHLPKTGGTYIASKLFPMFENGTRYKSNEWCCHEILMEKFYNNTQEYCTQKRIGIYEVWGDEYYEVLETCRKLYPQELYVGLISIREPIQRTLSLIHQQCNSGYSKKNSLYQEYCRNCTYNTESSISFWDPTFVNNTNRQYLSTLDFIERQQQPSVGGEGRSSSSSSPSTIPLFYVDSSMINDFFTRLSHGMRLRNSTLLDNAREIVNVENRSICDFGMKSSMIKKLRPSIDAYSTIFYQQQQQHNDKEDKLE